MSCKRSQGFLAEHDVKVREQIDARKVKMPEADALELAKRANRIIVAKGKKTVTFERNKADYDEKALLAAVIGPSGNLRAPAILRGKTLFVGFNEGAYEEGLT